MPRDGLQVSCLSSCYFSYVQSEILMEVMIKNFNPDKMKFRNTEISKAIKNQYNYVLRMINIRWE